MTDLRWGMRSRDRVLLALIYVGLYAVWPAIHDGWHEPALITARLLVVAFVVVLCVRGGRLVTAGDQIAVTGGMRTRRVHARDIAGIVRSTEMPWSLVIWTLDGRAIRTSTARTGRGERDATSRRLAELEAWWVAHRGADWSLDALQPA